MTAGLMLDAATLGWAGLEISMSDTDEQRRKEIGERLWRTRMLIDPNRTRIAEKYGQHHTVWQKWEDGRTYPNESVMIAWCNDTGITLDWIYRGVMTGLPQYLISMIQDKYPDYRSPGPPPPRELTPPADPQTMGIRRRSPPPFPGRAQAAPEPEPTPEAPPPKKRRRWLNSD